MSVSEEKRQQDLGEAGFKFGDSKEKKRSPPKRERERERRSSRPLTPEVETVKAAGEAIRDFTDNFKNPPLKQVTKKEAMRMLVWGPFFIALGASCVFAIVKLVKR